MSKQKVWSSPPPAVCGICRQAIVNEFVDGATRYGPWAIMCMNCLPDHGCGLGLGRGQHYTKLDGQWMLSMSPSLPTKE